MIETEPKGTSRRRRRLGMGSIYEKRGVWYADYTIPGIGRRQESSHSHKASDAKALLKQRLTEITANTYVGRAVERVTVNELLDDLVADYRVNGHKTLGHLEQVRLPRLRAFLGLDRAPRLTTERVRAYVAHRIEAGAAPATINRELAALKRAFRLAAQATPPRVQRVPHLPMLRENNVRIGFLEPAEYAAIRAHLPDWRYQLLGDLAYTYGLRKEEVRGLRWQQIDLAGGTMRLEPGTTKTGAGRTLVLTPDLRSGLQRLHEERRTLSPWVFASRRIGQRLDMRGAWEAARVAAGLGSILFHDTRRSAVRNMVRAGISERVAMTMSGHKTRSVFDRYHIVSETDLREAAAKLTAIATSGAALPRVRPIARTSLP